MKHADTGRQFAARMELGDHVMHSTGGGRGIYVDRRRVFVGSWLMGCVPWDDNEVVRVAEPPAEKLWADYCAWMLTL